MTSWSIWRKSIFSSFTILGTIRSKCQELCGLFFAFIPAKASCVSVPNAAYLSQSPCCLQRRGSIIHQTKPSCPTTLICMQPAAKAKPSQDTRRRTGISPKQIRAFSFTSSESDASDSTAEKFRERAHFKIDDVDKDSTAENK